MAEPRQDHERRDISPRGVLWFAGGLIFTVVIVFVAITFFQRALTRSRPTAERASWIGEMKRTAPAPVLESDPASVLRAVRSTDDAELGSYGWIDRKTGVVRIPIERAMELTAERGLPARKAVPGMNQ